MKLDVLQRNFLDAIFNIDRESALDHVKSDDRLDSKQRLNIYRGSVHGILTKSLGDTFPVTKQLLGEEFFDKMCDHFIDQYPPSTPFFSDYGDNLSNFLSSFKPLKSIAFIPDVAKFEWSRQKAWQQIPPETFDFSKIATLTEEQQSKLVFHLNSSVHLIKSDYRIDLIWFAHQDNSELDLETIDINEEVKLLIWKANNAIKIINLNLEESTHEDFTFEDKHNNIYWNFLNALSKNSPISELAAVFDEKFPELLNKSIQDGWIESFTCN